MLEPISSMHRTISKPAWCSVCALGYCLNLRTACRHGLCEVAPRGHAHQIGSAYCHSFACFNTEEWNEAVEDALEKKHSKFTHTVRSLAGDGGGSGRGGRGGGRGGGSKSVKGSTGSKAGST